MQQGIILSTEEYRVYKIIEHEEHLSLFGVYNRLPNRSRSMSECQEILQSLVKQGVVSYDDGIFSTTTVKVELGNLTAREFKYMLGKLKKANEYQLGIIKEQIEKRRC